MQIGPDTPLHILMAIAIVGLFVALRQAYADHLKSKEAEIKRLYDIAMSTTDVAEKTVAGRRRRE